MLDKLVRLLSIKVWKLQGFDTFAGEWYSLPGMFLTEQATLRAANRQLKKLEKLQPSRYSGGQTGIQDQLYIVRPDGTTYLYQPTEPS
jgi:hypothetical protein